METETIIEEYRSHIQDKEFPCIAAKTSLAKDQIHALVADHLACPKDDHAILEFLYGFIDDCRHTELPFSSAVVIFKNMPAVSEDIFDQLMWQRLQAISNMDSLRFPYDPSVASDPESPQFSFSVAGKAFYIIGLHPSSSRKARRFQFPALVFNPHEQFQKLRENGKYDSMKKTVRNRDEKFSGSVNPMLSDFGDRSEAFQYSGRLYNEDWKCPFISHHQNNENNSPS